ncbi:NAD(+)--rifampin ADP-ribosyltransferase [Tabrizicola sp.]|uniref:NAD(+)--rifampin ADP-ribosyltransferase n=1 Tax=Tabrizicola sp. TaxID=2005166 RepID=UPI0035B0AB98
MVGGPAHGFHGTKADLRAGDRIVPGFAANFGAGRPARWVYLTARLEIAVLAAELALGDGAARVYVVEPEGVVEDDPNVTDKKFPGNPTRSYRGQSLRVLGEVTGFATIPAPRLAEMRDFAARSRAEGIEPIE